MRYIISLPLKSTRKRSRRLALTTALGSLVMAGAALAEVPRVVTDVPPVHSLVALVMGDLGTPELLLEPGASEHHFQLRPSQARSLGAADLVVMIGPELTPWIEKPLSLREADAALLTLLQVKGTHLRDYDADADEGHDHDHDHDHDHEADDHSGHSKEDHSHGHEEHAHEGHDHDHSHDGLDPHAWLDPANGQLWLDAIAAELSRLDPENAALYSANAQTAHAQVAAAEADAQALLAPVAKRPFVTFHDAYGYYTAHFGLTQAGAISAGDASTPGARHLTELKAKVEAGEVICLFPEAGQDPALVERIAENTGLRIGEALDPVGTAMEPGPGLYSALLSETAQRLADCLAE